MSSDARKKPNLKLISNPYTFEDDSGFSVDLKLDLQHNVIRATLSSPESHFAFSKNFAKDAAQVLWTLAEKLP